MTRWRALLVLAGLGFAGGVGYLATLDGGNLLVQEAGRYRDGRGRDGRNGGRRGQPHYPPATVSTFYATMGTAENGSTPCTCAPLVMNYNGSSRLATVARSTEAACTKGNETTGIAVGDVVWCPANTPRWMPGGDGLGVPGVAVWDTRQNYLLQPEAFDNAAWVKSGGATVDADVALAPDNTMTADLVHFGTAGYVHEDTCPVNYVVRSVYARMPPLADGGVATSSAWGVCGNACPATNPTITSASWTRIMYSDQSDIAIYFSVQPNPYPAAAAQDLYLWQADCQTNTDQATNPLPPPIRIAGATAQEIVTVPAMVAFETSNLRVSVTRLPENAPVSSIPIDLGNHEGTTGFQLRLTSASKLICDNELGGLHDLVTADPTISQSVEVALSCTFSGLDRLEACVNGACVDAGFTLPHTTTLVSIGSYWNGFNQSDFANGVVKEISITSGSLHEGLAMGDSTVESHSAGLPWYPQNFIRNAFGNTVSFTNLGVSGRTVEQIRADWNGQVAQIRDAGLPSRTYLVVRGGVNSQGAPADGGTAFTNVTWHLKDMLTSGKNAGINVLWDTITPNCGSEPFIGNVNAEMQSWCTANGVPQTNTYAGWNDPGAPTCCSSVACVPDLLHPSDAGSKIQAANWPTGWGW